MSADIQREARELLDGITEGDWWWTHELRGRLIAGGDPYDLTGAREIIRCAALLHPGEADAEFIASSPRLVRELLAENERLAGQATLDVYAATHGMNLLREKSIEWRNERDEARTALDRVRAENERLYDETDPMRDVFLNAVLDELHEARAWAAWFAAKSRWLTSKSEHYLRRREAEATLDHVRALHNSEGLRWVGFPRADIQEAYCTTCQESAPCLTVRAIDGEGQS